MSEALKAEEEKRQREEKEEKERQEKLSKIDVLDGVLEVLCYIYKKLIAFKENLAAEFGFQKDYFFYRRTVINTQSEWLKVYVDLKRWSRRGYFTNDSETEDVTIKINDGPPIDVYHGETYSLDFHVTRDILVETLATSEVAFRCLVL